MKVIGTAPRVKSPCSGVDPEVGGRRYREHIGIMLQNGGIDAELTVTETARLYARFYRRPRSVREILTLVGLADDARRRVRTLSGGMKRRLDLCLALIGDIAGFAAPPPLRPLLRWRQDRPPFVLVVIDRAGADLTASAGAGGPERRWSITGPDDEIVRHALGGWAGLAQSRLQHRATDSWRHNAKSAAQQVVAALDEVAASVLIVSGDVRAVQLLLDQLPHRPGLQVRRIHGSRAFDGSQPSRSRRVAYELRDAAAEQVEALLATFREQLAPGGRAANGLRDVVAALAAGSVETLLIGEPADGRRVCFGARATDIFADRSAALTSGVRLCCGAAPDAAARAALLAGARVRVVPATVAAQPLDGIGAICRYAAA